MFKLGSDRSQEGAARARPRERPRRRPFTSRRQRGRRKAPNCSDEDRFSSPLELRQKSDELVDKKYNEKVVYTLNNGANNGEKTVKGEIKLNFSRLKGRCRR